jgi:hypothetical protein
MPLPGLRTEICAQGVATGGAVTVGQEALRWQARSERADSACAALWPRAPGWLTVRSGQAESAVYVYAAQDWPAWQAALRHDATARYASRGAQPVAGAIEADPAIRAAPRAGEPQPWATAVPRWMLGLAFALSVLLLWWRERR